MAVSFQSLSERSFSVTESLQVTYFPPSAHGVTQKVVTQPPSRSGWCGWCSALLAQTILLTPSVTPLSAPGGSLSAAWGPTALAATSALCIVRAEPCHNEPVHPQDTPFPPSGLYGPTSLSAWLLFCVTW